MTSLFNEFLDKVAQIDGFAERVKQIVLPKANRENLRLCNTNLVLEVDQNGAYTPYGCPLCLGVTPGQDKQGTPTLGGKQCIDAWSNGLKDHHLPPEVMLNMWFCPGCRIPLMSLVPRFE